MNFEEKVKSMKVHEIVDSMIQGIRKEWVKLDFDSFGDNIHGVCYGCGATNAICEIIQESFPRNYIFSRWVRQQFLECSRAFIECFEVSIDCLRMGDLSNFIVNLSFIKKFSETEIELIKSYQFLHSLPLLSNESISKNTLSSNLIEYEKFSDWLKSKDM